MLDKQIPKTKYIYDPVAQFKNTYKDLHYLNTKAYINELIKDSKIDTIANKETIEQIEKLESEKTETNSKINKLYFLRNFTFFLIIISTISTLYGVVSLIKYTFEIRYLFAAIFGMILFIMFIYLLNKKANPKLKELKNTHSLKLTKINELTHLAWNQMKPLNQLFTYGMSAKLFHKTIPLINLDETFDSKRLDYLVNKFGLEIANGLNQSTLYVQSGDINGNPFYICNNLVHYMGSKNYTGSIRISWTTTRRVNGRTTTRHHSQTLTASLKKPFPKYIENPYLVYGNEAAPDLSFKRKDSDAEKLTEKQIDKLVSKKTKKLEKLTEKSTSKGLNYTVMANSEFEVLFDATNRDNEVQFRLLFTPLAQKQLLDLMKDKKVGFGDNFAFEKRKKVNYIYPEHLRYSHLNIKPDYFYNYDFEKIKQNFVNYNEQYFKSIFFSIAPILAIPLYQQQKPQEYIYKDFYNSYVSFYEHEHVANMMNINEFKHPLSQTRNILKTSVVKSGDYCDTVKVTAYGYKTENRIDYITVYGGDGKYHKVPVSWVEYIPVSKNTDVNINIVKETKNESFNEKFRKLVEQLKNKEISEDKLYKISSFIAYTLKNNIK